VITRVNKLTGRLIRLISLVVLQYNPSLKSQLAFIHETITIFGHCEKEISVDLINALIEIEDKRFFKHSGVDVYSIARAFLKYISGGRLEGASTITQQLVRNVTGAREINLKRKVREILFSTLISKEFSKDEILLAYLNTYKFNGCIGAAAFCQNESYDWSNLSISQAAEIAARFKYPTLLRSNYVKYLKRVRIIEMKITTISA
jgi:membrane peptidoglycan carboxypeptidase